LVINLFIASTFLPPECKITCTNSPNPEKFEMLRSSKHNHRLHQEVGISTISP